MILTLRSNTFFEIGDNRVLISSTCFLQPGPLPVQVLPIPGSKLGAQLHSKSFFFSILIIGHYCGEKLSV